jgi:imidazolonepropionase-like amidohydrolase
MTPRSVALAFWLAAAAPLSAQLPQLDRRIVDGYVSVESPVVAITHVSLIDGTGAPARTDQTVVLRDGKIDAVGSAETVAVPSGATEIDGRGRTLIPGMIGLHDHLFYNAAGGRSNQMSFTGPRLYLGSGVTTIRTTGSASPYADINLKRDVDAGKVPGPHIVVTTPYLTGPAGGGRHLTVETPEQARRFVAYWAEEGADWIKFYTNISRAAMGAAIDEAHKRGMRATGHLCSVTFREAIELGLDDFAHGALTASDFVADKKPDECPANLFSVLDTAVNAAGPIASPLIELMVRKQVSMTTTMPVYEAFYPKRPVTDERTLELMTADVREAYLKDRAFIDSASVWPFTEQGFQRALAFDRAYFAAGGILASGVDPTGNGGALPGFGDQRGYELLREAGLTTEQAVQVVTLNGAKVLGHAEKVGSVEQGKRADLVLLDGDLTTDAAVIRKPVTVFKDGVGYDSAKLIAATKGRVGIN